MIAKIFLFTNFAESFYVVKGTTMKFSEFDDNLQFDMVSKIETLMLRKKFIASKSVVTITVIAQFGKYQNFGYIKISVLNILTVIAKK